MKSKIFLATVLMLLMIPLVSVQAAGVTGMQAGFGNGVDGVGAAFTFGTQDYVSPNSVLRFYYSKVNFTDVNVDNLGGMLINYIDLKKEWGLKIGHRTSADYEVESENMGIATGIELLKKGLFTTDMDAFISFDVVKRSDLPNYFTIGIGLILFP